MKLKLFIILLINVFVSDGYAASSRITKAEYDIIVLEQAVELFKNDFGRYPTTEEGLEILISPPKDLMTKYNIKEPYIKRLHTDPWSNNYQYIYPGIKNSSRFDIWTLGADGKYGGTGIDGDYGNWLGSFDEIKNNPRKEEFKKVIFLTIVIGALIGAAIGLPIFIAGIIRARNKAVDSKQIFFGFHFYAYVYLILIFPIIGLLISLFPIYIT